MLLLMFSILIAYQIEKRRTRTTIIVFIFNFVSSNFKLNKNQVSVCFVNERTLSEGEQKRTQPTIYLDSIFFFFYVVQMEILESTRSLSKI